MRPLAHDTRSATRAGLTYGVAAYAWWGLAPVYFKALTHVPALEVLAHRIVWSLLLLVPLVTWRGQWSAAIRALRGPTGAALAATSALIGANWYLFIWAVLGGHVREASLGYFINPLVSALMGLAILGERLSSAQIFSLVLAGSGVAYLTIAQGGLPWIALVLAISFAFYGLLRKTARVEALPGLMVETGALAPIAAAYLGWLAWSGEGALGTVSRWTDGLLLLAGVVTATPLLWFAHAARRLRLATLGFLQYLAPTLQFVLAVGVFGEAFTAAHAVAFGCIWAALAVYTADAVRRRPRTAALPPAGGEPVDPQLGEGRP